MPAGRTEFAVRHNRDHIMDFGALEGGTEETVCQCIKLCRPCKLIDSSEVTTNRPTELAQEWISKNRIRMLNVAGPRASQHPQAYEYAFDVVKALFGPPER